ncbi:hypothetical protein D7X94_07435 [Acutalibacter sp. 1XD8-33]|nr:hypothetical protein D7X94_07435 [Acutalibacter sp. 1XD8-33]
MQVAWRLILLNISNSDFTFEDRYCFLLVTRVRFDFSLTYIHIFALLKSRLSGIKKTARLRGFFERIFFYIHRM